jgi:acyl dehydratase
MMTTTQKTVNSVDELKAMIGQEMGVSAWVEMTQERVNAFADVTGDHQWIHVDVERAKASPLGGPIAHGYLTLSMLPVLRGQDWQGVKVDLGSKMAINYGLNRVRFISPVHVGKRIRLRSKLLSVDEVQPNIYQTVSENTIEIEGQEKPAMVAESIGRTYL